VVATNLDTEQGFSSRPQPLLSKLWNPCTRLWQHIRGPIDLARTIGPASWQSLTPQLPPTAAASLHLRFDVCAERPLLHHAAGSASEVHIPPTTVPCVQVAYRPAFIAATPNLSLALGTVANGPANRYFKTPVVGSFRCRSGGCHDGGSGPLPDPKQVKTAFDGVLLFSPSFPSSLPGKSMKPHISQISKRRLRDRYYKPSGTVLHEGRSPRRRRNRNTPRRPTIRGSAIKERRPYGATMISGLGNVPASSMRVIVPFHTAHSS